MNINMKEKTAVLEPTGDLLHGISSCVFRDKIYEVLNKNIIHVVVDLHNVKMINSLCIGALVGGFTSVKNAGGELKLANPNEKVKTILNVTRLDQIFHLYRNVEDALKSFNE